MTTNDATLTDALNAFCRRLVEGHPSLPTGQAWEEVDLDTQNKIKTNFLGPLHAAAQVLTKPAVVNSTEELAALPVGSIVLDANGDPWKLYGKTEDSDQHWATHEDWCFLPETLVRTHGPVTVLHLGGDRG